MLVGWAEDRRVTQAIHKPMEASGIEHRACVTANRQVVSRDLISQEQCAKQMQNSFCF